MNLTSLYHFGWAWFGDLFLRHPSRRLFVVGVTGTKGKSTVLELMNAIFEAAGKNTALLSSVRRKICASEAANLTGNTMPGRFAIQQFLNEAVQCGCEYAFIEVTSQGVVQHRHKFIDWDAAVFLNLAPEHIESHGSFEKYRDAKMEFFRSLATSRKKVKYFFINEEDKNQKYFEEAARAVPDSNISFFGRERFVKEDLGAQYDLSSAESRRLLGDWLMADFNLENAAAAVTFARSRGIHWKIIKRALDNFRGVPGRLEFVQKTPFAVVVDYAHTLDSLEKVYETLERGFLVDSGGELICVLGAAGGGRDKWKRPVLGQIAAEHCEKIILTNEDPFDENPEEIIKQVEEGFLTATHSRLKPNNYYPILDRRQAIQKAVQLAKKGDVVVVTGKGSEPYLRVAKGKKIPWSDRKVVEEALAQKERAH
ncbi:MAG: UDP-N-acetylmuramyl-tripeptide synthetase [Patescibacteria group bacterium]